MISLNKTSKVNDMDGCEKMWAIIVVAVIASIVVLAGMMHYKEYMFAKAGLQECVVMTTSGNQVEWQKTCQPVFALTSPVVGP